MKKPALQLFLLLSLAALPSSFVALPSSAERFPDRTGKLAAMRQSVWAEWCDALGRSLPVPPLAMKPLSEGAITSWEIPDSLEPHATLDFRSGTKGTEPEAGWPCYLYLHGSGPRDMEWQTGWQLAQAFDDAPAFCCIPKIPNEGKLYRWWQRGKLWAWGNLLRWTLAQPNVDASRLYVFGISEGAYGSQRLASYYADYFAAAGPMAGGEPLKNAPVENLGHTAFHFHTGDQDAMFYRNLLTQGTAEALDSIERLYPGEYHHSISLIPGRGHHIDYFPTTPWLSRHRRTPQPHHFLWENMEMDSVKRNCFYNLEVLAETDAYRTAYEFSTDGRNHIDISVKRVEYATTFVDRMWNIDLFFARHYADAEHGRLRVFLSEELIDLNRPVSITINGRTIYEGRAKISRETMRHAAKLWGDPLRLFPAAVEVEW